MKVQIRSPLRAIRAIGSSTQCSLKRVLILTTVGFTACNLAIPPPVDPKTPVIPEDCKPVEKIVKSGTRKGTRDKVIGTELIRNRYGDLIGSRDRVRSVSVDVPYRNVSYKRGRLRLNNEQLVRIVGRPDDVAALDAERAKFVQAGVKPPVPAQTGPRAGGRRAKPPRPGGRRAKPRRAPRPPRNRR